MVCDGVPETDAGCSSPQWWPAAAYLSCRPCMEGSKLLVKDGRQAEDDRRREWATVKMRPKTQVAHGDDDENKNGDNGGETIRTRHYVSRLSPF
ncbi:hypothetical protein V3C99_006009 [Haemonchus contortus]